MKRIFADAHYWVALGNRKDQSHQKAVEVSGQLGQAALVTTDEVLNEFLAYFSDSGPKTRTQSVESVRALLVNPNV